MACIDRIVVDSCSVFFISLFLNSDGDSIRYLSICFRTEPEMDREIS